MAGINNVYCIERKKMSDTTAPQYLTFFGGAGMSKSELYKQVELIKNTVSSELVTWHSLYYRDPRGA